jgi:hypothetical protein
MSVTLSLTPELTQKIREEAGRLGLTLEDLLLRDIEMQWLGKGVTPAQTREKELLAKISKGKPEAFWLQLRTLSAKRKSETLTETEHAELLSLTTEMERWGAERIAITSEIAQLWGISLRQAVEQLGLQPVNLEDSEDLKAA